MLFVGSVVGVVVLVVRAGRGARNAVAFTTNADVVRFIKEVKSSRPISITVRVDSVESTGLIHATYHPWYKKWALAGKAPDGTPSHTQGAPVPSDVHSSSVPAEAPATVTASGAAHRPMINTNSGSSTDTSSGAPGCGLVLWPYGISGESPLAAEWLSRALRPGTIAHVTPLRLYIASELVSRRDDGSGMTALASAISSTTTDSLWHRWFRHDLATHASVKGLSRSVGGIPTEAAVPEIPKPTSATALAGAKFTSRVDSNLLQQQEVARQKRIGVWEQQPSRTSWVSWLLRARPDKAIRKAVRRQRPGDPL